jgi:hypothetical protein
MPKTLTYAQLKSAGACANQRKQFKTLFGLSVEVTEALCLFVSDQFDWDWASRNLLSPAAQAEVDKVRAAARAEVDKVTAAAWAEYDKVTAAAWAEFDKVRAPAWAEYDKARAAAFGRLYAAD